MLYQLSGLTKKYGNSTVLSIKDLSISAGEIRAIVGPNGAGKTTLLKLLAFLDTPSAGEFIYQNQTVFPGQPDLLPLRRNITMVMQDHFLFSTSVYNNIAYGLRKRRIKPSIIKAKVNKALDLVGLTGFERRYAPTLSGGEGKRLALARALAIQPEVLILDEPTSNIDKQHQESIETIIRRTNQELQTSIIFSTLDKYQAYRMASSITSIINGQAIASAYDNIFKGVIQQQPGLAWMEIKPGLRIYLEGSVSDTQTIWIEPRDIIISHTALASSARNTLKGLITQTTLLENTVSITVNIGVDMAVLITRASYQELKLSVGEEVYLTFKASAVRIL